MALSKRRLKQFAALWQYLIEPGDHIKGFERRQQSRWLATLSFLIFFITLMVAPLLLLLPSGGLSVLVVGGSLILMLASYGLSRRGHPATAMRLLIVFGSLIVFLPLIISDRSSGANNLYYLIILSIFGGVFLSLRATFVTFLVHISVMVLFAMSGADNLNLVSGALTFNLIISPLAMLVTQYVRRMEAERRTKLEISERLYRNLVNNIDDIVYEHTLDGKLVSINDNAQRLSGWKTDKLIGASIQSFIHPDDLSLFKQFLSSPIYQEQAAQPIELRMKNHSGDFRTFEFKSTPQYENGQAVGYSGIGRDITERKQIEEALRESQRFAAQVTDAAPVMVIVYDLIEKRIIFINKYGANFFGQSQEMLTGADAIQLTDGLHPDDRQKMAMEVSQWLATPATDVCVVEHRIQNMSGMWRWFRSHHVVFDRDDNGRAIRLLIHSRDVTEQRQADEQSLQHMLDRERMELVNQFLLAVSHDFRTSLATIETSRYLADQYLPESARAKVVPKLEMIRGQVDRIADQLQNLHTIYSLNEPDFERLDIAVIMDSLLTQLKSTADQKQVLLTVQDSGGFPLVLADADKLKVAIKHLLVNALTHTPKGGAVSVMFEIIDTQLAVHIRDTGSGIQDTDLPHIFDVFYRADPSRTVDSGGVGLGLSIVKMIADSHGGSISVDSTLGQGSTFTLSIPLAA